MKFALSFQEENISWWMLIKESLSIENKMATDKIVVTLIVKEEEESENLEEGGVRRKNL